MSFLKAKVSFPSNFASIFSAIKHNSSVLFLAQTLYALVKSGPLKCKFLKFSSVLAKIRQIPLDNFELTNFASFFIVMTYKSPVSFKVIYFQLWTNGCHQSPKFEN